MKVTIIGAGNAGCITANHFSYWGSLLNKPIEVEMVYDPNIIPVPTGQGTTINYPYLLWQSLGVDTTTELPHTLKTGIMYENWGDYHEKIFHPFPFTNYSVHIEPSAFQNFIINNLNINFTHKEEHIIDYNQIDSDFIIDCRGKPQSFSNYKTLVNPLNCALLANLPPVKDDVKWTRTIATKDGWCFYIPLPKRTSIGYLFNQDITDRDIAINNFKELFPVEEINVFPFKQYVAKEPIIDNRILLNGNRLFFLEPLEATAMTTYHNLCHVYWDYINNIKDKNYTVNEVNKQIKEIESYILWHYKTGSKFKTSFWSYAKDLYKNNKSQKLEQIINRIKNIPDKLLRLNTKDENYFGMWSGWNHKIWYDHTNEN